MPTPDNRKARVGVPGLDGSGSAEVIENWQQPISEFPAPTQHAMLRSVMELWCEHLDFKLGLARIKLNAGAPDSQFVVLAAEIQEFAIVGRAIAAKQAGEVDNEEAAA